MTAQIVDAGFVESHIGTIPIIDVRTSMEYAEGHIPTAINVPLEELDTSVEDQARAFSRALRRLTFTEESPLIVYCQTGRRAMVACDLLEGLGYKNLYLYSGSMVDWEGDPSRPIEK